LHLNPFQQHTIVAISTPNGQGAIAVIRLSGGEAIAIADRMFKGKQLAEQATHTTHFGKIVNEGKIIDEVVISIYKNPHSYTGEDVIEISCHGSSFIIQQILNLSIQLGAKLALPGEFTKRAFLNGKLDLSQAEAVADVIASENESQHKLAIAQMRGGYSKQIEVLRQELIDFAALLELELDFSEEDVEFANREKFLQLVNHTLQTVHQLIQSFQVGNVLKNGVPVAIVGKPNVGKSTLLNQLLNEEKAIVSEIAGTTRDFIEDTIILNGIQYRFIDTAGIRNTLDVLEAKGIERSYEKMNLANIIIYLADINFPFQEIVADFKQLEIKENQEVIIVLNKSDEFSSVCNAYDVEESVATLTGKKTIEISAKENRNIDKLLQLIEQVVHSNINRTDIVVSNTRHLQSFKEAHHSLTLVKNGLLTNISGEFISIDIRTALQSLGNITGQITNEDVLSSVFSRFCIGK
jgi:tRNA modification GTPase